MIDKNVEETIANEINVILNDFILSYEAMDIESCLKIFSTDPNFYMLGRDGLIYDHETFYNANKNYFDLCSSYAITTYIRDINILTTELVLVSWHYKSVARLYEGSRDIFDTAGATFLFRKINNKWTVINYQESALPPKH